MYRKITVDPTICFGKPCITGTRVPVHLILELIENGLTPQEIIDQCYPDISLNDIKACFHYAASILKNEEITVQELV